LLKGKEANDPVCPKQAIHVLIIEAILLGERARRRSEVKWVLG
jgi:hypothetical protein